MSSSPKSYDPKAVDAKWYSFWETHQFFQADPHSSKPSYCIVMPPPNVTGVLHMGHALVNTLQDILIRWKRMRGFEVLWVPGTDHAGISTQTVVERHLMRTHGKKRKDYSREEFLSHVWSWKVMSETKIIDQLKKIGCSCDWSRLRFTMDEGNNQAVRTMFKKLFDAGLIYRGDYLVNWDCITQTALADDEVEYEERSSFLWHITYPVEDSNECLVVATTRPETMLGDTAVAVHPRDERYSHLIGKKILQPLTHRLIPIIADPFVDPSFGTGAVKITPAHDPNDYQMALRHKLPMINIMTEEGRINEKGGKFEGLTMEQARAAVVDALKKEGHLNKVEPHTLRVGISYRSKAVIEPFLSKQWFVRMDGFAKKLRQVVESGKTTLKPPHWDSTYFHWIDNLRDWCISRQLWWGHRIPIWYKKDNKEQMICQESEEIPAEVKKDPSLWIQETDVLDTWFSSALWPFSTLGWPENTPELKKFYPNSTLITGHDILFFWVARMLAFGEYAMEKEPFPECFLHGLIYGKSYWRKLEDGSIAYVTEEERLSYDLGKPVPEEVLSKWEKMSKSKGNIIDPLEMIDLYGTDAVRIALAASATHARQIDLDRRRFEEFKNFTNKIWNGARFVLMNLTETEAGSASPLSLEALSKGLNETLLSLEDRWILSKMGHVVAKVNRHLEEYAFDLAAKEAYDFFWKAFCAYFVELSKPVLFGKSGSLAERENKQKLLLIVLCTSIRLMHPMAPFITEELFHILKEAFGQASIDPLSDPYTQECLLALKSNACLVAPFPQVIRQTDLSESIEHTFALMEEIIYCIRNIRGEMKLSPGSATDVYLVGEAQDPIWQTAAANLHLISALVRTTSVHACNQEPALGFSCTGVSSGIKIILPLPSDLLEREKERLAKEKQKLLLSIEKLRGQLSNEAFVAKAPATLIEQQKKMLLQSEQELQSIEQKLF